MPWDAARKATLLVGTVAIAQEDTGEVRTSYTYTGASIPCRFFQRAVRSMQERHGQVQEIDAIAHVNYPEAVGTEVLEAATGERKQVKVTPEKGVATVYEVLLMRNLGSMGKVKELELKRWA